MCYAIGTKVCGKITITPTYTAKNLWKLLQKIAFRIPVKGIVDVNVNFDILYNCALSVFWQQLREVPLLFHFGCVPDCTQKQFGMETQVNKQAIAQPYWTPL